MASVGWGGLGAGPQGKGEEEQGPAVEEKTAAAAGSGWAAQEEAAPAGTSIRRQPS